MACSTSAELIKSLSAIVAQQGAAIAQLTADLSGHRGTNAVPIFAPQPAWHTVGVVNGGVAPDRALSNTSPMGVAWSMAGFGKRVGAKRSGLYHRGIFYRPRCESCQCGGFRCTHPARNYKLRARTPSRAAEDLDWRARSPAGLRTPQTQDSDPWFDGSSFDPWAKAAKQDGGNTRDGGATELASVSLFPFPAPADLADVNAGEANQVVEVNLGSAKIAEAKIAEAIMCFQDDEERVCPGGTSSCTSEFDKLCPQSPAAAAAADQAEYDQVVDENPDAEDKGDPEPHERSIFDPLYKPNPRFWEPIHWGGKATVIKVEHCNGEGFR